MDAKSPRNHVQILRRIARRAMIERGFLPEFSAEVRNEVAALRPEPEPPGVRDLQGLPWCSIDSDESLDLDQLTCARDAGGGVIMKQAAIPPLQRSSSSRRRGAGIRNAWDNPDAPSRFACAG